MEINNSIITEMQKWYKRLERRWERKLIPHIYDYVYTRRYGSSAPEPYKIIFIDPAEVTHLLVPHFWRHRNKFTTHILGGNWDRTHWDSEIMYDEQVTVSERQGGPGTRKLLRLDDYGLFRSMKEHFVENVPWEETEIYTWLLANCDSRWGMYDNPESVKSRLDEIDDLYTSMRDYGYVSQRDIYRDDGVEYSPPFVPPEAHEVAIDVGRNGTPILDDGRHRFMIAKILGVDEIPVRVLVRHRRWQEVRAEIADATSIDELNPRARSYVDHPDVDDVITESLRMNRQFTSALRS